MVLLANKINGLTYRFILITIVLHNYRCIIILIIIIIQVYHEIQTKSGKYFPYFTAEEYKYQVVAGINFEIKVEL